MDEKTIYFNGLDGATGTYSLAPMPLYRLARLIRGEAQDPDLAGKGVKAGIDPRELANVGWGVVFTPETPPGVREALAPLLEHRRGQAEAVAEGRYQELTYFPGESKLRFLARYGVGPGFVDPDQMPYYLLLVGGPEAIPFAFQYQLGVQYAVGRIAFDTLDEYARYAEAVITADGRARQSAPRAVLFGVENPDDPLTRLTVDHLVHPLARRLGDRLAGWRVETVTREQATKRRLAELLGGEQTPDLLLTASHGVCFRAGDPSQMPHQGALVCADWPGPKAWRGRLREDHFFSGDDLGESARLEGLISCHFACFTAGTPRFRTFDRNGDAQAPAAFTARLPPRLLGHLRGGALAAIGHVDLAWQHSFLWDEHHEQVQTFESALVAIAQGDPVGLALEAFGARHAEIAADQEATRTASREGIQPPSDEEQCRLWTAYQDARSYVLMGDPAVRLPIRRPRHQPLLDLPVGEARGAALR